MKLNWNFLGGGGRVQNKKPSIRGVWIFSGPAQCKFRCHSVLASKLLKKMPLNFIISPIESNFRYGSPIQVTGFIPKTKPILSVRLIWLILLVRVGEKEACCLSVVYAPMVD